MMKFAIRNEKPEKCVEFYLEIDADGDLCLKTDHDGDDWVICFLSRLDRKLYMVGDIDKSIGLSLDERGRVEIGN